MERRITATEANQRFSEMLRDVQGGESFVVTSRGKPVAKLVPIEPDHHEHRQNVQEFLEYVRTLPIRTVGDWQRDDLYER